MRLHELDKNSKFGYRRQGWSSHTGYIAFVNKAWVYITYRNDIEELTSYHTTATDWLLSDTPNRYYKRVAIVTKEYSSQFPKGTRIIQSDDWHPGYARWVKADYSDNESTFRTPGIDCVWEDEMESPFPCFRKWRDSSLIVKFRAPESGIVVVPDDHYTTGCSHSVWRDFNYAMWEPCEDPRQKRKFKVGDVVSRYKNGNTYIIVAVEDGRYRTSNGRYFIFRHENRWELVQSTTPSNLQAEKPEISIGSHWERVEPRSLLDNIICINGIEDERVTWGDYNKSVTIEYLVQNFTPRPDLDSPITEKTSCSPEPITPKQKETTMDLRLLLAMMAAMSNEETPKDATNSKHVVIVTKDDEYEGYFYSDCLDEVEEIVAKPSNELKKFHVFDYSTTLAQKPRKVVAVKRS